MSIVDQCLDAVAPIKQIKIAGHRVWRKPWKTKGLPRSMGKCMKPYKHSIRSNTTPEKENKYKSYRNCLVQIKRKAKTDYYNK